MQDEVDALLELAIEQFDSRVQKQKQQSLQSNGPSEEYVNAQIDLQRKQRQQQKLSLQEEISRWSVDLIGSKF